MKLFIYTIIFIMLQSLVSASAAESTRKSLRDGYSIQISQLDSGESMKLFHKTKLLGETHSYSIAPSGEYAAFQQSPAGQLFLYRVSDDALNELAKQSPGAVKKYSWNETYEIVRIYFDNQQETLSFAIE